MDFLDKIGIREKAHNKISIVGHSLGGYIAAQVAIENRDMIEKLVLIDSSGTLNGPTPLLELYLDAAMETNLQLKYKKVQNVFEDLYADGSRLLPVLVDTFIGTLDNQGQNLHLKKPLKTVRRHTFNKMDST